MYSWVWQYSLHSLCHVLKLGNTELFGLSMAMCIMSWRNWLIIVVCFLFFWLIMDGHLHSTVAVLELNTNMSQSKSNISQIFWEYAVIFSNVSVVMWLQSTMWFKIEIASGVFPQSCSLANFCFWCLDFDSKALKSEFVK